MMLVTQQKNNLRELKLNIEKNIGYLKTDEKNSKVYKTVEVGDDILVDLNSDDNIVGIELLNPIEQLGIKYKKKFLYPTNFIDNMALMVKDSKQGKINYEIEKGKY